jgi:hypothetical protein
MLRSLIAYLRSEPVLVSQLLAIAVSGAARFGFDLTIDQLSVVAAVVASVLGVGARQLVIPTIKAAAK